MPRICLITTTHPGCLSRLTCQSGCQIFSFISGHVSQGPQQRNTREEGRQCPAAASPLHGSFTRLGLAVVCPRAHHVKPWKCTKLPVGYLSFLLMPCASVLTVNSHLKQPCATELSAGNVSELHRPFKILPWMKGHQSARRDPYLWVRSPRQIHSITFFFFWVGFSIPVWLCRKAWKQRKSGKWKGERWLCSWEKALPWAHHLHPDAPSLLMGFEAAGPSSRIIILLNGDIFNPLNTVSPCSQPSIRVHTQPQSKKVAKAISFEKAAQKLRRKCPNKVLSVY